MLKNIIDISLFNFFALIIMIHKYYYLFTRPSIIVARFNNVAKFSPTKLNQTEFLTNQGINSYLFTEGALDFSPTKKNLLLILEISRQPVGEKCHTI